MSVVFNRRKGTTTAYDQAVIDLLEEIGLTVDIIDDDGFSGYDFSDTDLVVIGAPDYDFVSSHTSESIITGLECHVISFCRGVSRNALDISDGSSSTYVSSFTVVDNTHPIMQSLGWESGSFNLGPEMRTHRVTSLAGDTTLIMNNDSSGIAGLAERVVNGASKMHFGYHGADNFSQEGEDLFLEILDYLELEGAGMLSVEAPGRVQILGDFQKYGVQAEVIRTVSGSWEANIALWQVLGGELAESTSLVYAAAVEGTVRLEPFLMNLSFARMHGADIKTTSSVKIKAGVIKSSARVYKLSELLGDGVLIIPPIALSQSRADVLVVSIGVPLLIEAEVARSRQVILDASFIKNILDNFSWNDEVLLIVQDSAGEAKYFRGVVRDIEDSDKFVDVEVFLADGILSERIIREDFAEDDIGIIAREIITKYCRPLTAENVNTQTGIEAPIKAEGRTPVQVLENMRRNFGINFYVDNVWDAHLYKEEQIITDENNPFVFVLGEE
ncbi:hypothetical protein [Halarsenatibacter silvermanii]|uniref:Uncharacterized protein n=1 Tax=Halarsenatibacter silvermanii TaxID=321763 RepID=A0A1G9RDW1_9FIRM|nr:hypothetical protein [Halarsenatibacter silvermanii]SDM21240.1 hypothetical protein SAMN04488692_12146 [Halarsenatibacter silvermanii]